ncbi:proprotein convertase P-domain-containing protein [Streptomyces sp. NPDC001532]|uniref:proprotein convertase P-domain-containing protein n=1 Tax=Streptomyces sp. NPDC001532 TaxID=3154520 RepID=UPI0033179C4F
MTAISLGAAIPAQASAPPDPVTAMEATSGAIDPPLYDKTANGAKVRVNVLTKQRADLSAAAGAGKTLQSFDTLPLVTVKVDKAGLDELAAQSNVISVTEDIPVPPSLDQSVPLIGADAPAAAGLTGAGTAIAVLDTGVATQHPFLKGRVVAEACFSPIDADYSATSLCPDGTAEQEGTGTADSETGPCATIAGCDHGTHVAGIAAGNGKGIAGAPARGVAPGADIVAIQIFSKFSSEDYCGAGAAPCVLSFASAQLSALEKVQQLAQSGIPLVAANLSLGGGRYTSACEDDPRKVVIDGLLDAGVATVVAAGNNGNTDAVSSPACISSAVTVGATTDDDQLSAFTNRGPLLDVLAPGTGITSSVAGGGYSAKNGTSMAAPHVAGALSLLRQAFPAKSIASLESLLEATGKTLTYTGASTPRIDVGKAIGDSAPDPDPVAKPRPSRIINDTVLGIPDPGSVHSPITVSGVSGNAPEALRVSVLVKHGWLGDVQVDLIDPNGREYTLKLPNDTDSGGTLNRTYTVDASGSPAEGTWLLEVEDQWVGNTGTLDSWSLTFPTAFERSGAFPIPDPGTLTSDIAVSGVSGYAPGALQVAVNLTHGWLGDVQLDLLGPDGKVYALKAVNETGIEPSGTLNKTYTVDASGSPAGGTWKLRVDDQWVGSTGTLNSWSLTFPSFENQTTYTVPDPGSVQSLIPVSGVSGNAPKALRVSVDVTHGWFGDVQVELVDPNGKVYVLYEVNGADPGGTLRETYTVDASGSPAGGTWKLRVEDLWVGSSGTINSWTLTY